MTGAGHTQSAPIDGVQVRMGGRDWIVPALTFGQIKRLRPRLELLPAEPGALSAGQIDAIVDVVHAALSRNYPELGVEEVGERLLDLGNMAAVIAAVMTGSGLVAGDPAPGEVPAGGATWPAG